MRNLKKILALVMALVMSLSLVTIANAVDFTDSDDINYEEAAAVMSTIGVIEGFEDGSFDPDGTLTREQAAKLVTYMLLGDNAERLGIERSTFNDVAVTRWSAPAIEYCVSLGIIDGAGDGNFYPAGQLTGAAFAKVLLTAIGYDSEIENLVGAAWSVNVSALAAEVGLDSGIEDLSWSAPLTREQAAQMALNALQAPLVAYEGGVTVVVGDTPVSFGSGDAYYITTTLAREQRISDEQLTNSNDYTVEFGERYFPNLRLVRETDEFERPSHTWVYENTELGTYVDYDLLLETYTAKVTGRDLYELLGRSTIQHYDFTYYVDGEEKALDPNNLNRGNTAKIGETGNGVLTQVFVDHDDEEVIITSINTYLAQANADYNENSETLSLKVFESNATGVTKTVDSEDVANAVDVTEDQFVLVNMSKKDRSTKEVVKISDVEILTDATVTKFSQTGDANTEGFFTKLTADGEEYSASAEAHYDDEVLNLYDASLLTDMSYNVYLDEYGYAIGVDLYEGELNYVFITGYDRGSSYISIKTAQAGAIFLDGRMEEITVNVTNTNKNIDKLDDTNKDGVYDDEYYHEWGSRSTDGEYDLNTWYSYSVDANGVYTLRPVEGRMFATRYDFGRTDPVEVTINSANVRLNDSLHNNGRAYGNDNSIFITVEPGDVDESIAHGADLAIVDVNGLYTGVQSVDIEMTDSLNGGVADSVYTLKDSDDYIIASIILGDAQGSVSNYAYILTDAKSEGIVDGEYQWEFDAVMNGEKVTLTARSQYPNTIDDLRVDYVQELRFNGDYVVAVKDILPDNGIDPTVPTSTSKFIHDYSVDWDDHEVYDVDYNVMTLWLDGRTLKSSDTDGTDNGDLGVTLVSEDMPTVLEQQVNGEWTTTNYASMSEALAATGDALTNIDGLQFEGRIVGVFDNVGRLQWAYIYSETPVTTGSGSIVTDEDEGVKAEAIVNAWGGTIVSLTIDRPAYVADGSTGTVSFNIYVNGKLARMASVGIGPDVDYVVANSGNPYYVSSSPTDNVTVEITNVDYDDVYVRYINGDTGKEIAQNSTNFVTSTIPVRPTNIVDTATSQAINFTLNTTSEDDITWKVMQGNTELIDLSAAADANTPKFGTTSATTAVTDTAYVDVMIYGLEGAEEYVTLTGFNDTLDTEYPAWSGKLGASTKVQLSINTAGTTGATGVPAGSEVELIFKMDSLANTVNKGLVITMGDGNGWTWDVVIPNNGGSIRKTTTIKPTEDMTLTVVNVKTIDVPDITSVKLNDEADGDGNVDSNETITLTVVAHNDGAVTVDKSKITGTGGSMDISVAADGVITVTTAPTGSKGIITVAAGAFTDANGLQNVETKIEVPLTGLPAIQ